MHGSSRVQWKQYGGWLGRDTLPKGEKRSELTKPEHYCAIVLLYEDSKAACGATPQAARAQAGSLMRNVVPFPGRLSFTNSFPLW
jgi:hypothetical protein